MSLEPDRMLADLEGEVAVAHTRTLRRLRIAVLGAGVFLLVGLAVLNWSKRRRPPTPARARWRP